ncbi:MAG: DUF488 domain-containing protein [Patescibacteria group bacterium]|nr:DUF488 domain-containing protein [Patescibacteria group bacterium]
MLLTKSIQKTPTARDGIRICIMRRIKPEFVFDIWMPALAPSGELLKSYHDKQITWKDYERFFTKQVLNRQQKYLDILLSIAEKHVVTILCWEETPEKCHRRLVAQRIQKLNPSLTIKYR